MINKVASLIAWRYLLHKEKDSNIAVMIKICFVGILIGTFALMLTLIITNGFEKVIHEKMRGINAQIVMYSQGNRLDFDSISHVINKEFGASLHGISANSFKQVIVDHNNQQTVLFLKGINPSTEGSVTNLADKIIIPQLPQDNRLPLLLKPNHVLIGYKMAQEFQLTVGQELTIMVPEPKSKKNLALKKHTVIIGGIFKVGLEEYDNNLAFIAMDSLNELFDEQGVDQITLKLNKDSDSYEQETIERMNKRFPHLTIKSWKEMYPALIASLKLEKWVMFLILALITLVACMNMISLLFMQIQHKRRDIAIFKAMGLSNRQIRSIFLRMGLTITMSASLCGLALAAVVGRLIEKYPIIQLPDVYYVSYLPARLDMEIFVIVFVVTLLLGFIATAIPTRQSTKLSIAHILRQD
jgi:lipoprotein-releasing system permease protein